MLATMHDRLKIICTLSALIVALPIAVYSCGGGGGGGGDRERLRREYRQDKEKYKDKWGIPRVMNER